MRAIAILALLSLSGAAQAAPHGIYRPDRVTPQQNQTGEAPTKLLYYGGPVISHARIYAVFWGDKVLAETKSKIGPFLASMVDSPYMDWLSEYDTVGLTAVDGRAGTNQRIGRGTFGGSMTIQPARAGADLTDRDIQLELEEQIAAGRLPAADEDTLYMTYLPPGVSVTIEGSRSCVQMCAYHEGFKAKSGAPIYYGVMPVCGGFGCGGSFDSLTSVSSHEALEAITDPFPTPGSNPAYPQAWNTSTGEEVADLCTGSSARLTSRGFTSVVQAEWSNVAGKCINGPWTEKGVAAAQPSAIAPLLKNLLGLPAAPNWDGRN